MNSPASITTRFAIQPVLIERHRKTLEWLSATELWKSELVFLQKLLDHYSSKQPDLTVKINHYQNILLYYKEELVDTMASRLRLHEQMLTQLIVSQREESTQYFVEHDQIMNDAQALCRQIQIYREEIYNLIERIITSEA